MRHRILNFLFIFMFLASGEPGLSVGVSSDEGFDEFFSALSLAPLIEGGKTSVEEVWCSGERGEFAKPSLSPAFLMLSGIFRLQRDEPHAGHDSRRIEAHTNQLRNRLKELWMTRGELPGFVFEDRSELESATPEEAWDQLRNELLHVLSSRYLDLESGDLVSALSDDDATRLFNLWSRRPSASTFFTDDPEAIVENRFLRWEDCHKFVMWIRFFYEAYISFSLIKEEGTEDVGAQPDGIFEELFTFESDILPDSFKSMEYALNAARRIFNQTRDVYDQEPNGSTWTQENGHRDFLMTPADEIHIEEGNSILSEEDAKVCTDLILKARTTENVAGFAASQLGYLKKIFLYHNAWGESPEEHEGEKGKRVPTSTALLANVKYFSSEESKTHHTGESCFSVKSTFGFVTRFTDIEWSGWRVVPQKEGADGTFTDLEIIHIKLDNNGELSPTPSRYRVERVESAEAQGFPAHIIQHETDHTDGMCFTERLTKEERQGALEPTLDRIRAEREAEAATTPAS